MGIYVLMHLLPFVFILFMVVFDTSKALSAMIFCGLSLFNSSILTVKSMSKTTTADRGVAFKRAKYLQITLVGVTLVVVILRISYVAIFHIPEKNLYFSNLPMEIGMHAWYAIFILFGLIGN